MTDVSEKQQKTPRWRFSVAPMMESWRAREKRFVIMKVKRSHRFAFVLFFVLRCRGSGPVSDESFQLLRNANYDRRT